jgi:hypothetical protein
MQIVKRVIFAKSASCLTNSDFCSGILHLCNAARLVVCATWIVIRDSPKKTQGESRHVRSHDTLSGFRSVNGAVFKRTRCRADFNQVHPLSCDLAATIAKILSTVGGISVSLRDVTGIFTWEVRRTGYLPPFLRNLLKEGQVSPTPRGVFELQSQLLPLLLWQHILVNIWIKEIPVSHQNTTPMVAIFLQLPLYPFSPSPYNPTWRAHHRPELLQ